MKLTFLFIATAVNGYFGYLVPAVALDDIENIKSFHNQNLQKFSDLFYDAQGKISAEGQEWQHTLVCHSMHVTGKVDQPYTAFKKYVREDMLGESQNKPEHHCLRNWIKTPAKAHASIALLDQMTKAKGAYKEALDKLTDPLKALITDKGLKTSICSHQGKSARNEFGWYVASYDTSHQEALVCSADNFDPP